MLIVSINNSPQDATLGTVVIQNLFTDFEMPSQRKGLESPS